MILSVAKANQDSILSLTKPFSDCLSKGTCNNEQDEVITKFSAETNGKILDLIVFNFCCKSAAHILRPSIRPANKTLLVLANFGRTSKFFSP